MAASTFPTLNLSSEQYVESAGAIPFHVSTKRVALIYSKVRGEWLLAKGRRNWGESRAVAAAREAREETGYKCTLLPLMLSTRATPPEDEDVDMADVPRVLSDAVEPFMVSIRDMSRGGSSDTKLIWWFIAAIDEDQEVSALRPAGEDKYDVGLFTYDEALRALKYRLDRDVVQKAVTIMTNMEENNLKPDTA